MKRFLFLFLLLLFVFSISCMASEILSPALDVIAYNNGMIKAGIFNNGEICFDTDDFDYTIGASVKSITVSSLPSESDGRLMLGNLYVVTNQVIYRDDFSMLKFVKTSDNNEVVFKFRANGSSYETECSLKALESVNLSPIGSNGEVISSWTKSSISCFGVLEGYDPEGDELKFEIVSYPEKGLIYVLNEATGDYKYAPYIGASGSDSFSYRVRDSYGNYSEATHVEFEIEKYSSDYVFSDIENEKWLNAVIVMCETGLMQGEIGEDGAISFKPDEEITREEFLVLVMNAMGAKNVPLLEKTRFADDNEISNEYKGYIEGAFSLGIIEGVREEDGIHFNPQETITLAEGAVIINKIIGAKLESSMTTFKDEGEIPEYARDAIKALTEIGVLSKTDGKINATAPLTRAQTAQILMSLLKFRGKLN